MKNGKVPENVLKRSVLRQIKTKRAEVVRGAGIGEDCALFASDGWGAFVSCVQTAAVWAEAGAEKPSVPELMITPGHLIQRCANNLAAAGARPIGVMIALTLPEGAEEPELKALMADAEDKCRELDIQIAGGQTQVSRAVICPIAAVTGYGKPFLTDGRGAEPGSTELNSTELNSSEGKNCREGCMSEAAGGNGAERLYAGQDIVVSKWIGLEGTALLARQYKDRLLERYPAYFVEEAAGFGRFLSVIPEAATAVKSGVCLMHDASGGGILGALWELAERAGAGLTIDLKKIPLRQETVEVCECCNVNPYGLLSGGALLMVTKDGQGLAAALEAEKIPAAVVGRLTDSNDRVIVNGGETRFLYRP